MHIVALHPDIGGDDAAEKHAAALQVIWPLHMGMAAENISVIKPNCWTFITSVMWPHKHVVTV